MFYHITDIPQFFFSLYKHQVISVLEAGHLNIHYGTDGDQFSHFENFFLYSHWLVVRPAEYIDTGLERQLCRRDFCS